MKRTATYRKRRLGALLVALVTACALYAGTGAGADPSPVFYTVVPGDTLWSIATEHYPPSEDPREKIEDIRRENRLDGYTLQPGMRLEVPR